MAIDAKRRRGRRPIFLRWSTGEREATARGLLAFVKQGRQVEVWRSPDTDQEAPSRLLTLPGPLRPRRLARFLVESDLGPSIEPARTECPVVEGTDGRGEELLALAWARDDGGTDPRTLAVLSLDEATLDAIEDGRGPLDARTVPEVGASILAAREAWLARWRGEIEAEIERRLAAERPDEADAGRRRDELRGFVEDFLSRLGRLPRPGEREASRDGLRAPSGRLTQAKRRTQGTLLARRTRCHHLRVYFVSPPEVDGGDHREVGWYAFVTDPDDSWRFNDPIGPFRTPGEAVSGSGYVDGDEE